MASPREKANQRHNNVSLGYAAFTKAERRLKEFYMITLPIAKINLGLNVVEKRPDGYHNLETVFYPVPINDALEVFPMDPQFPSAVDCDLKVTNINIDGDEQRNLVVRAYNLLKADFPTLPRIHAHLYKGIPTQAGMGGGSSDCGFMITLLNQMFNLGLTDQQRVPTVLSSFSIALAMPRVLARSFSPSISTLRDGTSRWYVPISQCPHARPLRSSSHSTLRCAAAKL